MIRYMVTVMIALLFTDLPVWAADVVPPSVTVSGTGRVFTRPDMAEISIGVTSQASTAAAALAANTEAMNKLIATLKAHGVADKDILTSDFNVSPDYQSTDSQRRPRIVGYRVGNTVQVKVRDLNKLGALLDAAVQSGANNIHGITFTVAAPEPLLDQARARAVADAKRQAEVLAQAAGIKLGRVLYVNETGRAIVPPLARFGAEALSMREAAVPVATGEQEMTASVQVVYAIEP